MTSETTTETADEARDISRTINVDLEAMRFLKSRLDISDYGRLAQQIARAGSAKRPSELQRLLIAIVTYREVVHE